MNDIVAPVYNYRDSFHGYVTISYISCSSSATEDELQECTITPRGSTSSCNYLCTTPAAIKCYNGMYTCTQEYMYDKFGL